MVVPYAEFPPVLRQAIISIEDKSFESNWGVNLFRAVGAAYRDLHSQGRAQGASTLTMQLARNLFLSSEKTYGRKIQEIFLSVQIERRFTKEQIFELYANQIYLGHGTYGFEAGSEFYFSKHVQGPDAAGGGAAGGAAEGAGGLFAAEVSGARAAAAEPGAERDAARPQDHAGSRRTRQRQRRWGCTSSLRRTALRRTLSKRFGGSLRSSMAWRRCMALGCACTRRSISICSWWRTRRCSTARRLTSGGMAGRRSLQNVVLEGLDRRQLPASRLGAAARHGELLPWRW